MDAIRHDLGGRDDEALIVRAPDVVNHTNADLLRETVRNRLPDRDDAAVILDFSDVELITSIGIAALLQIKEICDDARAPMVLVGVTGPVANMLRLLKLADHFLRVRTIEDAVDEIERMR